MSRKLRAARSWRPSLGEKWLLRVRCWHNLLWEMYWTFSSLLCGEDTPRHAVGCNHRRTERMSPIQLESGSRQSPWRIVRRASGQPDSNQNDGPSLLFDPPPLASVSQKTPSKMESQKLGAPAVSTLAGGYDRRSDV